MYGWWSGYIPLLATTGEEIVSASGSHYDELYHIAELGAQYCTYSPAMYQLKELRKGMMERVAMVGTRCQIHTADGANSKEVRIRYE